MHKNTALQSIIVSLSCLCFVMGCGEKTTISSGELSAPTLDDYPALTNESALTLTGKRSANSAIWYQRVGQSEAIKGVVAGSEETWSFTVNLNEGTNRITITASSSDESVFSDSIQAVVTLDSIAPDAPVVNPHEESLVVEEGGTQAVNLSGTKDPDGSLDLNGSTITEVDGQSGWVASVDVGAGVNTYSLTSTDLAGNVSDPAVVSIAGSTANLDPILLDAVPAVTREDPYPLSGSKAAGIAVWLVQLESGDENISTDPVEIVTENNNTTWSYSLNLGEGENNFYVYAQDAEGAISAPASATTVLDTIAPEAPVLDEVADSTGDASLTITGEKAADGNLCMRRDQEPTCAEVAAPGGTTIDQVVPLNDGVNFICLSSVDVAGNTSDETCVTVYKLLGPQLSILAPDAGSVISSSTVLVEAEALGGTEPGAHVAAVEVCLDELPCVSAAEDGDIYHTSLSLDGIENGSLLTITVTATNGVNVQSTESITVLYQAGALLISDTLVPGHGISVSINQDASGTTHVVWTDECVQFPGCITYDQGDNNAPWDILYRKFDSAGWSDIQLLSNGDGSLDGDSKDSTSVIDESGLLHIVWSDTGDSLSISDYDIFHRTLDTQNGSMSDIQVVANSDLDDAEPTLAAGDDGSVHLVWRRRTTTADHDIFHVRWTAAGGFGDATEISSAVGNGNSQKADVAVDSSGDAHIVWQDNGTVFSPTNDDQDIHYRAFDAGELLDTVLISNSGNIGGQIGSFDDAADADSRTPSISISQNDIIYIAWHDELQLLGSGTDFDIFFQVIDTAGNFITTVYQSFDQNNARSSYHSSGVSIEAIDDDHAALFWSERNASNEDNVAFLKASRVGSTGTYTWSNPQIVSVTTEGLSATEIAVFVDDDDVAHLAWTDDLSAGDADGVRPNNEGEDFDIFYQALPLP